jgi:succinate-semialdehyde dehydrogenase/glutarate-semialdehyde dehydrogenase
MEASPKTRERKAAGTLESFNPATGELIGSVPTIAPGEVQGIVDEVAQVQPFWAELSLADRARYMRRAAREIVDNIDELAQLLSQEQGKPITEAYSMELLPTVDALHWVAKNGPKILSDEKVPLTQPFLFNKRAQWRYKPLGVVGVIAPWNYPWTIPLGEIAIALMAGNGVVFKPASLTCLIGSKIEEIFTVAGLPEGLLRTIHGGGAVGNALVESSAKKIFFTGSEGVGKQIGIQCAEQMKGSVLELGGKDAMVVLSDANIDHAIKGALWGSFANGGQTCSGVERVYVMHDVADRFIDGVVAGAKKLRVGDPSRWDTELGPMTSDDQFALVQELVDDAVKHGATLHCGGPTAVEGFSGNFYAPAVLTGVNHSMRIMQEEIFGAVVPIVTVDSEEEAIRMANDSEFGLGASVWTADKRKGLEIAGRLEAGSVWVNDHLFTHGMCQCSWGGVKSSGTGRSHSKYGFLECVEIQQQLYNPQAATDLWWYPYEETVGPSIRASVFALFGRGSQRRKAVFGSIGPMTRITIRNILDYFKK